MSISMKLLPLLLPLVWIIDNTSALVFLLFLSSKNSDVLTSCIFSYVSPSSLVATSKYILLALTSIQIIRFVRALQIASTPLADGFLKPMLFPCRTSHTRLFPKKHTFSYSYLLAGVPVGWKGTRGGFLSVDLPEKKKSWYQRLLAITPDARSTWYSVDAKDYLEPGHVDRGLYGKLRRYLETQGACIEDFPYIYLVTAAKFMNYVSNPVSFWHLYGPDKELKAFVVEVNNTFNERHMYFLRPDARKTQASQFPNNADFDWENIEKAASEFDSEFKQAHQSSTKIARSWSKEFYVSPFNSRKGSYSQVSYDPLFPALTGNGPINTTITLNSSKAHAKLVARVFSTSPGIDPSEMTTLAKIRFLVSWWWVGLFTFIRTVYQAGFLMSRRKMGFLFRPEPLKYTVGRPADEAEKLLESLFRTFLRELVESSDLPVMVKYISAGLSETVEEVMVSASAQLAPKIETLEFRVLSPIFYTRFVHYTDTLDALHHEFYQSRTISLSDPLIILDFLPSKSKSIIIFRPTKMWERLGMRYIPKLRARPAAIGGAAYAKDSIKAVVPPLPRLKIIHDGQLSAFDKFVLRRGVDHEKYLQTIIKLFISDRIALGDLSIMGMELFLVKSTIAWVLAKQCKL